MASRPQRYYSLATPRATARHSLVELRDPYPPHWRDAQQPFETFQKPHRSEEQQPFETFQKPHRSEEQQPFETFQKPHRSEEQQPFETFQKPHRSEEQQPFETFQKPHRGEEQQTLLLRTGASASADFSYAQEFYASDTSASFSPSRPPVLSGSSAQPPRATPAAASAPRGGSSASLPRGDALMSSAHRRAISASAACEERLVLPLPPRGDKPAAACAFRRRRHQVALSKKPSSEANAAAAPTVFKARASNENFSSRPACCTIPSIPRSLRRGSLFYFPADEGTRKQHADGADGATSPEGSSPMPRVFARSTAYSTPASVVTRHTPAPQGNPNSRAVASQAASDSAAEAAPSTAARTASGVVGKTARSFFQRITPHGHEAGNSAGAVRAGPSSNTTPATPTSSASSPAVRIYSSSSAPSSPCTPLPCTRPCRTSSPPPNSSSSASTTMRAKAEARREQPVHVKPCLTAPSSTRTCSSAPGSPSRSPKRVSFVKYVEILEHVA
ncbi:unnamed protein product [Closterium sp. Yama58-4]|nr:unnamed protein product [Closterium sp. Yama58-4]